MSNSKSVPADALAGRLQAAVVEERRSLVRVFRGMAKEWRKKARSYASARAGRAYGVAADCERHASECEMAAGVVKSRGC